MWYYHSGRVIEVLLVQLREELNIKKDHVAQTRKSVRLVGIEYCFGKLHNLKKNHFYGLEFLSNKQ
jgi:hypothetical protein